MRSLLAASFVAFTMMLSFSAHAEEAASPAIMAVEKTPFHVPVFRNDLVRMLSVYIPAGRTSPYHTHSIDQASVFVRPAKTRAQVLGEPPVDRDIIPGTVAFADYAKKPLTHQVSNIDSEPFWLVGAEIMYPEPGRFTPSSRAEVPDYKLVLDNDRIRAWRIVLEPGQSAAAITQKAPGVRIVVDGGELIQSEAGRPDQNMILKVGDFFWQDAGATRAVRNSGASRIEFVEFELK
ncbi:hypothetical protein RZS28_07710 [Methylocapsa polymorpha]|uniref:Cupin 2 conserved barrel domain-containing protein n=1 Tax=Methylocapsa polymorpha TaxID=3080828 RepID=A0ABZ0HW65_9HYPH|nr:hypothetical protein RZS28_07710 [Methylocapsa sp. RX1]